MGLPSGLKWAPMNIDALQKRNFALSHFQYDCSFVSWGNLEPHNPNNEQKFEYDWGGVNQQEPWYEGQPYGSTLGSELETDIDLEHDFANKICGSKWRMPKSEEFKELFDNCDFVQADGTTVIDAGTTDKRVTVNGVVGIYLKSKINGNLLFFACSGRGNGTSWSGRGSSGYYWSASFDSARLAYNLHFGSGGVDPQGSYNRFLGFAVRPVYDESLGTKDGGSSTDDGGGSNSDTLAAPTISGNTTFTESTQVTITAAEGATIKYTTDGTNPSSASTTYSAALTITATTTVKAIAIKDGVTSSVASKVFTKSSDDGGMGQD